MKPRQSKPKPNMMQQLVVQHSKHAATARHESVDIAHQAFAKQYCSIVLNDARKKMSAIFEYLEEAVDPNDPEGRAMLLDRQCAHVASIIDRMQ